MKYAEVLFQQKIGQNEATLTYSIPEGINIEAGHAVMVKIRNRIKHGIVWNIHGRKPDFRTQPIQEKIFKEKVLSKEQIQLINWMSDYYFCPLFKIMKLFVPKRIMEGKPVKARIKKLNAPVLMEEKQLTEKQKQTISAITNGDKNNFLIHGITGSGKTEIYSRLAKEQIKKGKQVLILVPEISLTPQIIEYFENSLGIHASVINSKISEGEKHKTWQEIWKNETKLIIGSRSAIFSPFSDLGLIIIDEEHEFSYKQDNAPRYTTHKVAEKIQESKPEIKIILGSATPSIESIEKYKDSTIELNDRIGKSELPQVELVDLRDEFKKRNYSIFSERLKEEITKSIERKEQVILFINRRGSASSIVCRDCGFSSKCSDCEINMTFHSRTLNRETLICHHCGKVEAPPKSCPTCKGINIRHLGIGTQKIESELIKEFPNIRAIRADKDSTSTKDGFNKIYKAFKNHEADVLIGTQMIAKGLHLPKVNLVGVILADIGLNIPDFRSAERNFQLLTQVAGRSGRSGSTGKVIIQTYNPENIALSATKEQSFEKFLNYERTQRKILKNPPFSNLAKILIQGPSDIEAKKRANDLVQELERCSQIGIMNKNIELNLYPAYIHKIKNQFRYIILIKSTEKDLIHKTLKKLPKEYIMDINIKIDIDPIYTT